MWFFQELFLINGDIRLFRKNGVLAFFHVLIQGTECTFGISVTIA